MSFAELLALLRIVSWNHYLSPAQNQNMSTWQFLQKHLATQPCALLYVLNSEGSSPGRQGFKMVVTIDGKMHGSIGGGIMEFKLVELAKDLLKKGDKSIIYKEQNHDKDSPVNQSDLICSGRQEICILPFYDAKDQELRKLLLAHEKQEQGVLTLHASGLQFECGIKPVRRYVFVFRDVMDWHFREWIGFRNRLHILGGGHVGAALSRQMAMLDFDVMVYDDREQVHTLGEPTPAMAVRQIDYEHFPAMETSAESDYIALMTFEYRTDKILLQQFLHKEFRYLGLMGSKSKVQRIFSELKKEGFAERLIAKVYAPIGMPICSQTPEEIAVSIAAQIIRVKNEGIPTGRETR
jgi:xanthine dehydrogenase accessory factor